MANAIVYEGIVQILIYIQCYFDLWTWESKSHSSKQQRLLVGDFVCIRFVEVSEFGIRRYNPGTKENLNLDTEILLCYILHHSVQNSHKVVNENNTYWFLLSGMSENKVIMLSYFTVTCIQWLVLSCYSNTNIQQTRVPWKNYSILHEVKTNHDKIGSS